jgi:hypothetical protein
VVLEFKGSEVTLWTEEGGKKGNEFTLKVLAVEEGRAESHLVLEHSTKYTIYYDFQDDKLILVGRLPNRPFEGFSLSGEYRRLEKAK